MDNVRRALGINDAVYSERPVPLTLFGDYNQLDPGGDEEEETEDPLDQVSFSSSAGGGGVATRVMPRHLAVQRMNLARRRRNKLGAAIPDPAPGNTAVDILGGIISCQSDLFTTKSPDLAPIKRLDLNTPAARIRTAAVHSAASPASSGSGAPAAQCSNTSSQNTSNTCSDNNGVAAGSEGGGAGSSSEDVYNNIVEAEAGGEDLPQLSVAGLRHLVTRSQDTEQLPALSENGLAKLTQGSKTEVYDPENPGDPSDDDLVIDDGKDTDDIPLDDVPDIPLPDKEPNKIKISLTTTSATLGQPSAAHNSNKESPSPKKKSVISDIFGSDEEEDDVVKSKESVKASEEDKVCDNEAVNYSDVSDKEIDASQSSRDLSVSPINSDQSESFEKAATLEGLNPEAISPEEDFTSLSEEEEGELKNYERRKSM